VIRPRLAGLAVVLAVAASNAVGACSLTTSLDGFTGGTLADAGPFPDADAATDAPIPDAGVADAPIDAPAAAPFCESLSPKPMFCDDFERPTVMGAWKDTFTSGGGMVDLAPSSRTTTGRELRAMIPLFSGSGVAFARLEKVFPLAEAVSYSFSLFIDAAPAESGSQTMNLVISPPASNGDFYSFYLFNRVSGFTLIEQTFPNGSGVNGAFVEHVLSTPITYAKWQRIEVKAKLTSPTRLTVTVEGQTAYDAPAHPFVRPGSITLSAGIHYGESPVGPLALRIDDLVLDAK
jgi:hypothetical protein